MRERTKTNRRDKNKKTKLYFVIFTIAFLAIVAGLIYLKFINKPTYLSPLPLNYKINSPPLPDQNTIILKKELRAGRIEYVKISPVGDYYVVDLVDKSKIYLSGNKDISAQMASLQFILSRLTMDGKAFNELDLRFDKPVVRLKKL